MNLSLRASTFNQSNIVCDKLYLVDSQFRHTLRSRCRDDGLKSVSLIDKLKFIGHYLAGVKIEGVSYVTPTVIPERGLRLVNPLIPAKSTRNPEARICIPKRASP